MNYFRDIGNILLYMLPVTGFLSFKRILLTLMGIEVGSGVSINGHTWFYGRGQVCIGSNTWIGPGCKFYTTIGTVIEIGSECDIAPDVIFVTGAHKIGTPERRAGEGYSRSIKIGSGCWIGARTTILAGVNIGSGTLVAAGSVVRSDLPSNCLAAGVPAELKKLFLDK